MMDYQSFCGIPVHAEGRLVALVAFHPEAHAFDDLFVLKARITAERVGWAIERKTLCDTRANEARDAAYGMALACLAHEQASDLTTLDAYLNELEEEESDRAYLLDKVRKHVAEISEKTTILRGRKAGSGRASVVDCVTKAAIACRTVISETIDDPARIVIDPLDAPPGSWEVSAPAASLIIVFFNLFLNAAQQIDLASSVRKHGRIQCSITPLEGSGRKPCARVVIRDTGPGIHHDDWERVFDPGYSTKPNGSGLGLYICRHLLRSPGRSSMKKAAR